MMIFCKKHNDYTSTHLKQMRPSRACTTEAKRNANALRIKKLVALIVLLLYLNSTPAHAQCANPVGAAGDMMYNQDSNVMQWCDNTQWWGVGQDPYIPNAVAFDGVNDDLESPNPVTGGADTKLVTFSFWAKRNADEQMNVFSAYDTLITETRMRLRYAGVSGNSENIALELWNSSNTAILSFQETGGLTYDGGWHHYMASIDLENPANRHVYIDGVAAPIFWATYTDDFFDVTGITDFFTGVAVDGVSQRFDGDIADLWIDFGTYFDLSDPNIRRMFIDASGFPVNLGADGSRPTGSAPDIFLSGDTATWHTNDGTGGGFTENGALTDALTDPGENLGPTNGLISWWRLDETAGPTMVDSGTLSNDGIYQGGLDPALHAEPGVINHGLNTENGNFHEAVAPDNVAYQNLSDMTLAVWIKPYAFSSHMGFLEVDNVARLWFSFNSNRFQFSADAWDNGAGDGLWRRNGAAPRGEWTHIAVTYSYNDPVGTDPEIYINGVQVPHNGKVGPSGAYTPPGAAFVRIGSMQFGGLRNFHGVIDDARIYDRELDAAEIAELYNTGRACQNPDSLRGGDVMYNSTHNVMQYCNNREWKAMSDSPGDGGAGCTNPVGVAGDMMYNSTSSVMQYCEGDTWRAIGKYN